MENVASSAKQLFLNVLGNIGAGLVVALGTAIWERIRHQSVDWYGIAVLFLLTCITFFFLLRRRPPVTKPTFADKGDWREAFRTPHWELVSGHTFVNATVDVDGKSFRDCKFENVTLMFHGKAPVDFGGTNQISGGFSVTTDDPAAMLYSKLRRFAGSIPGARIAEGEVSEKGDLLPDHFKISPIGPAGEGIAEADNAKVTLNQHDPRIRIELISSPTEKAPWKETHVFFHNEGGSTAYRVKLEEIDLSSTKPKKVTVSFHALEAIPANTSQDTVAVVDTELGLFANDIVPFFKWLLEESRSSEIIRPIVVAYYDYSDVKFETTAELVYVPASPETDAELAADFESVAAQYLRKNPLEVSVHRKIRQSKSQIYH